MLTGNQLQILAGDSEELERSQADLCEETGQEGLTYLTISFTGNVTGDSARADFTGDSKADLIWRNYSTGDNAFWAMNGATVIATGPLPGRTDLNWRIEATGDFNQDGMPDLVWRNYATGANAVWLMSGNTLLESVALPSNSDLSWHIVAAADFSEDGKVDLVWRNLATGSNACWVMNGLNLETTFGFPAQTDQHWQLVAAGDFTGDNRADLVWRQDISPGSNAIWAMNGSTYQASYDLPSNGDPFWKIVANADYNGDGLLDLVWRNSSSGANAYWFLGNKGVLLGTQSIAGTTDLSWEISGPR